MKNTIIVLFLLVLVGCREEERSEEETFPIAKISTSYGDMYFWLYDETPVHKSKFIELAKTHVYDEYSFNRVIKNFVIQGGCPDSTKYFENSPYLLDPEFLDSIGHTYGALGMGRDDNPAKQSNACQFYIVNKESGLSTLDGNYMIFGKIIEGEDVLETIEAVQTDPTDTPLERIPLEVSILNHTQTELLNTYDFKIP